MVVGKLLEERVNKVSTSALKKGKKVTNRLVMKGQIER